MLAQTLGTGKAQVLVYANMNVNQTTKESLEYAKTGTPLAAEQVDRNARRHRQRRRRRDRHREPHRRRQRRRRQVQLQARNHHLLARRQQDRHPLDGRARHGRKPARLGAARQIRARRRAAGDPRSDHQRRGHPDQARGHDLDRAGRVRQDHHRRSAASSPLGMAKYALLGLGAILFLFFTTRSLRKREKETIDEPVWLRELEAPMRLSELERETSPRAGPRDGRGRAGQRRRQRATAGAGTVRRASASRSSSSSTATPIASPSSCAAGCRRASPRWPPSRQRTRPGGCRRRHRASCRPRSSPSSGRARRRC